MARRPRGFRRRVWGQVSGNRAGLAAHWEHVVPFFAFPVAVRRTFYTTDEIDKRFLASRGIFFGAGDLVAKRGASAASAARRPFGPCRIEALAHLVFFSPCLPAIDETRVVAFGLLGDAHFLVAQSFHVVGEGGAALIALLLRLARLQFHRAASCWRPAPGAPTDSLDPSSANASTNRELARDGNGGDLMAALGADADEEGMQRARRLGRRPSRLDEHRAGVTAADLADAPVMGRAEPGLSPRGFSPK